MNTPTAHSLFSASGASRWVTCPGSLALTQRMPKSRGGTAAGSPGSITRRAFANSSAKAPCPRKVSVGMAYLPGE